jgi:hypothetical protein
MPTALSSAAETANPNPPPETELPMQENQPVQPQAEEQRRQIISREQILARLWEIANLDPELTRNSVAGQIKAIAMIVSIEGLIPDRAVKPSAQPQPEPNVFVAFAKNQEEVTASQPQPYLDAEPNAHPVSPSGTTSSAPLEVTNRTKTSNFIEFYKPKPLSTRAISQMAWIDNTPITSITAQATP